MNRMIELIINSGNGNIIPANEILNIPFTKQILNKSVAIKTMLHHLVITYMR